MLMSEEQIKMAMSSLLIEIQTQLDLFLDAPIPQAIYKDFETPTDRDSFRDGDVWFSSPNQNRFFLKDLSRRDVYEYRNSIGAYIFEYSLSFSKTLLRPKRPAIVVKDVKGFVITIKDELQHMAGQREHKVTWLDLNVLRQHTDLIPAIAGIKKDPAYDTNFVTLPLFNIGGAASIYEEKIEAGSLHNPVKISNNARNKDIKHSKDNEWRIWLSTGDFKPYGGIALQHLVEYLKFSGLNIGKYCEIIN